MSDDTTNGNVNGDVTPISKKPIDQLDSSEWDNMTIAQLVDQRNSLYNRMVLAQSMGQGNYVPAMQRGLALLDALLKQKGMGEDTHLI